MTRAFTLLELSIVLVIIGLIVGGVVAGQELIRNAELNAIGSDVNRIRTAVNNYRFKYNALPGDHDQAAAYWPSSTSGNGDGVIQSGETYRVFEQLSLSNLLTETYNSNNDYIAGQSVMGWGDRAVYILAGNDFTFYPKQVTGAQNVICISMNNVDQACEGPVPNLYASEVFSLDAKLDDGNADGGQLAAATCNVDGLSFEELTPPTDLATLDLRYEIAGNNNCDLAFGL